MNETLYMYVDESGDANPCTSDTFSIGAFISTKPIQDDFFDEAFEKLKNDKDFEKRDQKTIDRGYFHASFDSKNAHSHCCRAIEAIDWPCEFSWVMLKKDKMIENEKRALDTQAKIHEHLLTLKGIPLLSANYYTVELYIAKRPKSFTEQSPRQWEEYFVIEILKSLIKSPMIPAAIPAFEISVDDATNSGIQVCDFLLWAAQRKKLSKPKDKWLERTDNTDKNLIQFPNFEMKLEFDLEESPLFFRDYFFNKEIENNSIPIEQLPKINTKIPNEERCKAYIELEGWIRYAFENSHLVRNRIISEKLLKLLPKLDKVKIHHRIAIEMAELFLLLADHVPLYNRDDKKSMSYAWLLKYICCLTCDMNMINWQSMARDWVMVREAVLTDHPDIFDKKT